MIWRWLGLALLVVVLTACGKHYWEAPGRGVQEFSRDSSECIKEATGKYNVTSEGVYRACMKARGWVRVQSPNPNDRQFRGPEDDDEFASPPDPLSQRAVNPTRDPSCSGSAALRRPGVVCR